MLEIKNMNVRFGPISVLYDVSLSVDVGQIVCLLGPNGAGKTTLIRSIVGLVKPAGGSIWFNGVRISDLPSHKVIASGIGVVPEGRRVFPKMTIEENLRMGAFVDWTAEDFDQRREYVYSLFPKLADRRTQRAGTMSGGEQAMLAIGRALMGRPKLLLLDEPSLGLSPLFVEILFGIIKEVKDRGTTVLLVEQNARKALAIANRGFVLQKGQIVGSGSSTDLAGSETVRHAYLRH